MLDADSLDRCFGCSAANAVSDGQSSKHTAVDAFRKTGWRSSRRKALCLWKKNPQMETRSRRYPAYVMAIPHGS